MRETEKRDRAVQGRDHAVLHDVLVRYCLVVFTVESILSTALINMCNKHVCIYKCICVDYFNRKYFTGVGGNFISFLKNCIHGYILTENSESGTLVDFLEAEIWAIR